MSPWQIVKEIKSRLQARRWEDDGSNSIVFGSVHVTQASIERIMEESTLPAIAISISGARFDPTNQEFSDLIEQDFDLSIIQSVAADAVGESALIGGNRTSGQGSSLGRGLLEIEEEAFGSVGEVLTSLGIQHQVVLKSRVDATWIEDMGYLVWRDYRLQALCTTSRFYHPVTKFTAVDAAGGGDADLAWTNPPSRHDYIRNVVRRASGATPPASATAGTGVTLGSDTATSVTDSPGAGTFSYAVFAAYNETGGTVNERFSASRTATVVVT